MTVPVHDNYCLVSEGHVHLSEEHVHLSEGHVPVSEGHGHVSEGHGYAHCLDFALLHNDETIHVSHTLLFLLSEGFSEKWKTTILSSL